jgi:hypothetical protein
MSQQRETQKLKIASKGNYIPKGIHKDQEHYISSSKCSKKKRKRGNVSDVPKSKRSKSKLIKRSTHLISVS